MGHDGEGIMVDNVQVVAMARWDDRMIGPINVAVTDDSRSPMGMGIDVIDWVFRRYRHALRLTIS